MFSIANCRTSCSSIGYLPQTFPTYRTLISLAYTHLTTGELGHGRSQRPLGIEGNTARAKAPVGAGTYSTDGSGKSVNSDPPSEQNLPTADSWTAAKLAMLPVPLLLQFAACKPHFLREAKQRNSQQNCRRKKQNAGAIDMSQAKKLAGEKGRKQQSSAHPASERH
jgi:hypothetical protein